MDFWFLIIKPYTKMTNLLFSVGIATLIRHGRPFYTVSPMATCICGENYPSKLRVGQIEY